MEYLIKTIETENRKVLVVRGAWGGEVVGMNTWCLMSIELQDEKFSSFAKKNSRDESHNNVECT